MALGRRHDETVSARWRAACVNGVLHVAFAAALAAESAAHRCADRIADAGPAPRRGGRRAPSGRRGRAPRRPQAAPSGRRARKR